MANDAQPDRDIAVEERLEALLDRYGAFLRGAIARVCPRNLGIQIADIEQEARLRIWRALRDERDLTNVASYLYRIAVTTTIDAVRRVHSRHEEQLQLEPPEPGSEQPAAHVGLADLRPLPDKVAETQLLVETVQRAVARLAENRRIAVELHLDGMTTQEIADLMDWTEAKARNLAYRGMEELRETLRAMGVSGSRPDK